MSIKNKNKKTNLLTRIIKDKKGLYVSTAMKIVLSIVLGITTLTGSVLVVKDMVMPRTSEKIAEAFDNDYSSGAGGGGSGGGSSGGSGGGSTTTRNGTIPAGCTYELADGTVLNAGANMPFAPSADDMYEEGDYFYVYKTSGSTVGWSVMVSGRSGRVNSSYGIILSEIAGKPVTTMSNTFRECARLTTAPTIPNSVTNMDCTFDGCTSLTTAPTIPNSVTNMNGTFQGCTSLTTAPVIPNGVTKLTCAFFGCTNLTTVPTIPDGVTDMGSTFSGCTSLTTAPTIPNSVTNMDGTFCGCTSLTAAPTIPNSVTNMNGTFKNCTSITVAPTIPDSVIYMRETFSGCTNLTTASTIPDGVKYMTYTFFGCTSLTGTIEIHAIPASQGECSGCFENTEAPITLTGSPYMPVLAATSRAGNITVE